MVQDIKEHFLRVHTETAGAHVHISTDYQLRPHSPKKLSVFTWNDLKIPAALDAKYGILFSCDNGVETDVPLRMEATGMLRTRDIDIKRLIHKQSDSL